MDLALTWKLLMLLMALSDPMCEAASVKATVGQDVTLNCNYTWSTPLPDNPTIIWKNESGVTLEQGKNSLSLPLSKVSINNSGKYECHIRDVGFQENIHLHVSARKMEIQPTERPTGGAAAHLSLCSIALFVLPLYLI